MRNGSCIGIAGLGLIGGSLALTLAERRPEWRLLGYDPDAATGAAARSAGALHETVSSPDALLAACDLVVLCQPIDALLRELARQADAPRLPVMCDVASVKTAVLSAADASLGERRGQFVGAHPIAGKAQSGWAAAEPGLFDERPVVLCPKGADADALLQVQALWRAAGAVPVLMDAERHDAVYAGVSHLPQLLTWVYLTAQSGQAWWPDAGALTGPGFASYTRLGQSSPALWTGIALHNRGPLLAAIDAYGGVLDDFRTALQHADANALHTLFDHARSAVERHHPPERER